MFAVLLTLALSLLKCPWRIRRHSCSDKKEFLENFFLKCAILYFLHSKSMKNFYDWIEFLIKLQALSEKLFHIGFSQFVHSYFSYLPSENWCANLQTYAWQYNTGAHQFLGRLSPFQVFYGREPRSDIVTFELLPTCLNIKEDPKYLKDWRKNMENLLKTVQENQNRSSEKMILRHKNKNPPSEYEKSDTL